MNRQRQAGRRRRQERDECRQSVSTPRLGMH
jgi:hypothetical protein